MKVLHVITCLGDGGAEGTLYRLISHCKNHEYYVVSLMGQGKYGPLLREQGVKVYSLNLPQGRVTISGLVKLYRLIKEVDPQIVQCWLYHADLIGGIVARIAGVRKIYWGIRHSNLSVGTVKKSTIITAKLSALLSRLVPYKIICCSEEAVTAHINIGYVPKKFILIQNGYDLSLYTPLNLPDSRMKKQLNLPTDIPLIGMVARFNPQKDHFNLITALANLKKEGIDFFCILIGVDVNDSNQQLKGWISKFSLDSNIMLLGSRNDIPIIMNTIDIHVLSSLGEAFPNVLAEAMACGTPCVTTDVGDAAIIVGDTGWIVKPQEPQLLAEALSNAIKQLNDPESWSNRKVSARKRIVENFSIEKMVSSYNNAWTME